MIINVTSELFGLYYNNTLGWLDFITAPKQWLVKQKNSGGYILQIIPKLFNVIYGHFFLFFLLHLMEFLT